MTNEEIDKVLEDALNLYMKYENEKAEKELRKLDKKEIKFSKEHQKKLKNILNKYKKN